MLLRLISDQIGSSRNASDMRTESAWFEHIKGYELSWNRYIMGVSPASPKATNGIVIQNTPLPLPSTSFPVHL